MIVQGAATQGQLHLMFWLENVSVPSFVYVLQGEPDTPIKVGIAKDVGARIASLQTGNPQRLRLLHVVPGDQMLEWNFHKRLKADQVIGEWFGGELVDDFLPYVEDLAERMVAAYKGGAIAPHYTAFDTFDLRIPRAVVKPASKAATQPVLKKWRRKGPCSDVTVRFVEPDPVTPPDVAKQMRESVRGCSPSVYLGPANSLVYQRITVSQDFGN